MNTPQHSDPADLVMKTERDKQLYEAIGTLSEVQRRRLLLYFSDGSTYRQIAGLEGVNQSAVGNSIRCALKQLYKSLAD